MRGPGARPGGSLLGLLCRAGSQKEPGAAWRAGVSGKDMGAGNGARGGEGAGMGERGAEAGGLPFGALEEEAAKMRGALEGVGEWGWDVFSLKEASGGRELQVGLG